MAIESMNERSISWNESGHYYEGDILTGVTGPTIAIPVLSTEKPISCTLIAGANTGKFQITTSSNAKIAAGTEVWQDWTKGVQTGTVSDVLVGRNERVIAAVKHNRNNQKPAQ